MLTYLLRASEIPSSSPSEAQSNAVGLPIPDNIKTFHGSPGKSIIYSSRRFGDINLQLSEPENKDEHRFFAHHIWNSGIQLAEFISDAQADGRWSVVNESVLELGAGTGIVGITAALAGCKEMVLSDYPSQKILDTLEGNVDMNIPAHIQKTGRVVVQGHEWGALFSRFAVTHGQRFTRILCADCLWMDFEHRSLALSMLHFLSLTDNAQVWVLAGFHTGRAKLASFFDIVVQVGMEVQNIWERDADGNERDWDRSREDQERNRWMVIGILRRPMTIITTESKRCPGLTTDTTSKFA